MGKKASINDNYYEDTTTTARPQNTYTSTSGWIQYKGQEGWVCPKCGRVNAPWIATCPCYDDKGYTMTWTGQFTADPCKGCSNNPINGGSGICHCTLGLKNKVSC